jgi:hypothetical protein
MTPADPNIDVDRSGNDQAQRDVLDFLVTEEQLGVTFLTAAIENASRTPVGAR